MSVNNGAAPSSYFLNDKRIDDLDSKIQGIYATSDALSTGLGNKLNSADLETSIDALSKYALAADVSGFLSTADLQTEIDALSRYAVAADVYSKVEADSLLAAKANTSTLSGYVTSSGLDDAVAALNYQKDTDVTSSINSALADYVSSAGLDSAVSGLGYITNSVTDGISTKLGNLKTALNTLFNAMAAQVGGAAASDYAAASSDVYDALN